MKRTFNAVAGLTLAIATAASAAHAQSRTNSRTATPVASSSGPITFGMGLGVSAPTSDMGNAVGTGLHVQGMGTYRMMSAPLAIRGELALHHFLDKDYNAGGNDWSAHANVLSLVGNMVYSFQTQQTVRPYVLGGLGWYRSSYSGEMSVFGESDSWNHTSNDLGLNVGGGFNFPMGTRNAFFEARFHSAGDTHFVPLTFGVNF